MKFDFIIGNPPYQGDNHQQIYPFFYKEGLKNANVVEMIFPIGWQDPKNANNLRQMNNSEVKEDKQIVQIDNRQNVFSGITGAEWTNIIMWKKGYDNGLNGKQRVFTNGKNVEIKKLIYNKDEIEKPKEIVVLNSIIKSRDDFKPLADMVSVRKPYGLSTDFLDDPSKYNLPACFDNQQAKTDYCIYGLKKRKSVICFLPINYPIPRKTQAVEKYKVLIGKAWGNFSVNYLGGAYADIVIASPHEICTENFLECGIFNDYETAKKHGKYLMTQFCRALLFVNKNTQDNSRDKWISVPVQDYHEEWWSKSIAEIDRELMKKYNVPPDIQDFVFANIQERTEENIVNFR